MQFFTYLGSLACIGLYFFTGENVEYGIICAITASIGFAGSLVFYNAFLPEVATEDKMDRVSARGFAMGYIGRVILLIINLILLQYPESLGLENTGTASRFGFILVGVWWMGFAQIAFHYLEDRATGKPTTLEIMGNGIRELKKVFAVVKSKKVMYRFLSAFFIYSMGVQTVMLLASLFGQQIVLMEANEMIIVILILQIVAIGGAYIFAWISKLKGNGFSIGSTLIIWIFICVASSFLNDKIAFFGLAGLLGFVMGGVQSISRSTYSKLIPENTKDTASFFSFYDITEKLAIVIGTATYASIEATTGNMRNSMLFMSLFFVGGFVVLQFAKLKKNLNYDK
jgi:UMF1 family MFS transporter